MLVAYSVALDLTRSLKPIIPAVRQHSTELADQMERAAISVVLNLSEGNHRDKGDRKRLFVYARGSAGEIRSALDIADAWGWSLDAVAAKRILDRLMALLYGLTR